MENGNLYHVKIDQEANQDQVPEQGNSQSEEIDNTRPRCLGGAGNFQCPCLDDMPEQAIGHLRDAANRCQSASRALASLIEQLFQEANQDQMPEQGNSQSEEIDNTRPRCLGGAGNFQCSCLDDMPEQAIGHLRDAANRCQSSSRALASLIEQLFHRLSQSFLCCFGFQSKNLDNLSEVFLGPDHEPHSSEVGQDNNEVVETFQIEASSADSPIFLEEGCTINENNQTAAAGPTPEYLYTEKTEDLTSPVPKSQNHSRPSSHQVLEEEVGNQPSPTPSEIEMPPHKIPSDQQLSSDEDDLSSEEDLSNYDHITWDGFNDPICKPFGQNCLLCGGDLAFSPEEGNGFCLIISGVAVLSCGHAFHCMCLEHITSDKYKDPPCFICVNGYLE